MTKTIILNFSHKLTDAQLKQIDDLYFSKVERALDIPFQIDLTAPIAEQVREILDGIPLIPEKWENSLFLVNLPGLAVGACVLLAELHGRIGRFPDIIVIRPENGHFVVAEIVNLLQVRNDARARRFG